MIGVEGQYRASFSIGDIKDFLREEQLLVFKVIEDTGNTIPIFQLDIQIWDDRVLKYVNEGKELVVSLGKTIDKMTDSRFKITKSVPVRDGEHKYTLHMVGIFAEMSYISDKKVFISDKVSSLDVMRQVLTRHEKFSFDTNIASTQDRMHWIQPHATDRKFVSHIWNHTYIPDSFPALGTTLGGQFRFRDVKSLAKTPPKWIFKVERKESKKDNEIIYEMPFDYSTNSTWNNQLYAFGKEKLVANLESGEFTLLTQGAVTPTLAMSSDSMTDKDVSPRYDSHSNQSADNVHPNFWKAKLQNLVNLFTFSTVRLKLFYHHDFHDIHVLDLAYFKEDELGSSRKFASETITGLYIVTKVVRMIENKSFRTYVEMCRETPNAIQIRNVTQQSKNVLKGVVR